MKEKRIILTPVQSKSLPLFIETIGYNPDQEKIDRQGGYPHYHWLQTVRGAGQFTINGQTYTIPENSGILLRPHTPHSYEAGTDNWETIYVTFNGSIIGELLAHIGVKLDTLFQWEANTPINQPIFNYINQTDQQMDLFGFQASTTVYQLLLMINHYARSEKQPVISGNLDKLRPLIDWMNQQVGNPEVGLYELADYLDLSPRRLNVLFQETFSISPYSYFIDLRLRTAKRLLADSKNMTVKEIAHSVGFRSPSHFVATFKKRFGIPPEQFRKLH
ncbi:AraC family transcriptional regulator [Pullulanibacillus sp. KACC 23026]|uniref:AraC family transcriptional regulator n=1 Tax=Pullulanibacillus sp. KACC 23026 TaxID=3028315 RepID=UPI0023AE7493|nr:helix-turn-helix domain-containing protein [Pullulanibacillus sp. KACC 23026]WEG13677.1 AraC family transcriptional regulator [Pullulanibacillus sp. KACC 23026]